jgi:hypothetical protein
VSGDTVACVGDIDSGENLKVAEEESACDKGVGPVNLAGPSGLDFLLLEEDVEGSRIRGTKEVGIVNGPKRILNPVSENNPNPVPNPVIMVSEKQGHVELNQFVLDNQFLLSSPLSKDEGDMTTNKLVFSSLSENTSPSQRVVEGIHPKLQPVKKHGNRIKLPLGSGPKCLQFVEAVKEVGGGGRRRRIKGGGEGGRSRSVPAKQRRSVAIGVVNVVDESGQTSSSNGIESTVERNFDLEGLNLEVVLPGPVVANSFDPVSQDSGAVSVVPESPLCSVDNNGQLIKEAKIILGIEKQVGFSFPINEEVIINNLVEEEIKDQDKMKVKEQLNCDQ